MTGTTHLLVMLATPLVPLAFALALLIRRDSRALQTLAALAALPALLTSLAVPAGLSLTLPWLLEGSELGLDRTGRRFLFFSAAIWLAASLYARGTQARAAHGRFLVFFLLAMSGNLGLVVARDALLFYLFFALMSFATYGLIVHEPNAAGRHAGRVYMALVVAADMMIYAALTAAALASGGELLIETVRVEILASPYRDLIFTLLFVGFGVKAGLLGVHFVLPLIYGAAPTPAGAALAGAMLNAGLLGWLRFLPFGHGLAGWGAALVTLGLAAAFYGVLAGLTQRRRTVTLAYSSMSQMGILTAAAGAALRAPEHAAEILGAVTLYAMHHAFAKGALFLGIGAADAQGAERRRLRVRAGLILPALALTGAPLTSGMLAKEHLKEAVAAPADAWAGLLAAALPWTALATTLIVARFLWLEWYGSRDRARSPAAAAADAPRAEAAARYAWLALLLLSIFAVWLVPLEQRPALWRTSVLWETTWPVLAGAAAAAGGATLAAAGRLRRVPPVPSGDVGVPAVRVCRAFAAALHGAALGPLPSARDAARGAIGSVLLRPAWTIAAAALERWFKRWDVATALFAALIVGLAILSAAS